MRRTEVSYSSTVNIYLRTIFIGRWLKSSYFCMQCLGRYMNGFIVVCIVEKWKRMKMLLIEMFSIGIPAIRHLFQIN